ncbi:MAG: hypothetical protein IPN06_20190 [Burkholderiales bacterium]|nr:hypothetical protein [Burkholderiales bacterium]
MTKEELLRIMRLLSALEALGIVRECSIPDYLLDELTNCVAIVELEILK